MSEKEQSKGWEDNSVPCPFCPYLYCEKTLLILLVICKARFSFPCPLCSHLHQCKSFCCRNILCLFSLTYFDASNFTRFRPKKDQVFNLLGIGWNKFAYHIHYWGNKGSNPHPLTRGVTKKFLKEYRWVQSKMVS